MEMNSKPEELDILDRRIRQIEIEIVALKREKDEKKVILLNKGFELKETENLFMLKQKEKQIVDDLQQTKSNIEDLKLQADRSERGDYGVVAELIWKTSR